MTAGTRRSAAKEERKRQKAELRRLEAAQREEKQRRAEARRDKEREREAALQEAEDAAQSELEAKRARLEAAAAEELEGWKRDMVVEDQGEEDAALRAWEPGGAERLRLVEFVRTSRVVSFHAIADRFHLSPREAMRRIQELQVHYLIPLCS